ncbi:MAG: relaxase/mobilization nuclease domain-containing protein, partial [Desulfovibrionales bacterium]|nr:relaxase/mobilization nuclease domain-containing protein [Desulfovibrionales bacterium]
MLMKVFRHGVGRGSSVINYVTDAKMPKRQHSPPEILRGDPQQVKQLIDSTSRKWKYTSGVLSWAPEDKVTPEQERKLMDSFERHAFAGMEPDQYSILWVRHSHAGHHEMHFVIPRTELRSDKALNPCPPGWDKQYNPLCELWNRRNNWARPDEAKRARLVSPGVTIESYRSGTAAEIRTAVTEAILQGVEAGVISNRDEMVSELKSIGFSVPRKGKDYITIEIPQDDSTKKKPQRIRLKGALYAESWNAAEQRLGLGEQTQSPNGRTDPRDAADNARRIAKLEQRVAEIHKARAEYNRKRFGR